MGIHCPIVFFCDRSILSSTFSQSFISLLLHWHLPRIVAREQWVVVIAHTVTACNAGPIPVIIGAELFRQRPRPKAMAVANVVNWIGTFVIALCFESVAVSKAIRVYTIKPICPALLFCCTS